MSSNATTDPSVESPELNRALEDRVRRRRRMFVMPVVIVLVAGITWLWGEETDKARDTALFNATTALVQGHLQHTATQSTPMRLRWAEPAMESVFLAGMTELMDQPQSPVITVQGAQTEPDSPTPVDIVAGEVSIVLMIHPTHSLDIGVIRSVTRQ
jgi:hypothetical protein